MTTDTPNSPHPALGIDHGDARIGIAATDDFGILAHPVETIDRAKVDAIERIAQLEPDLVLPVQQTTALAGDGALLERDAEIRAAIAWLKTGNTAVVAAQAVPDRH